MASVTKLSSKEIEELEIWTSISDTITALYNELNNVEFEYGTFSPQYNEVADKIKLSLEVESDMENKFFLDSILLNKICSYPAFSENNRLQERIKHDYRVLENNKNNPIYHKLRNASKKMDEEQIKLATFCYYSFDFARNKSLLVHIDEELKKNLDEEQRRKIIILKNLIISSNGMLEKMYFSMCDPDALLLYDERFADYADMHLEEYNEYKNAFFKTSCLDLINNLSVVKKRKRDNQDWIYELFLASNLDNMKNPDLIYNYVSKHFEELDKEGSLRVISRAIEKAKINKNEKSVKTLRLDRWF